MVYSPEYFDTLDSARSIVRSNLRADLRNSVTDSYLEEAVEMGELYTNSFLDSAAIDKDNLSTTEKTNARNMSTVNSLIYIAGILPLTAEEKRDYLTQMKERLEEAEVRFMKAKFPSSQVESQYRRISPGYGRTWEEDS